MPNINLISVMPELLLLAGAMGTLFFFGRGGQKAAAWTAAIVVTISLLISSLSFGRAGGSAISGFDGLIARDAITLLFLALMDLSGLVAIALSWNGRSGDTSGGESYSLALFALLGMHLMACGRDLLVIFLGLETLALPLYVLVGFDKNSRNGMEGSVKYFLLGSFSSAVFLLGLAFYYGATGTTGLAGLGKMAAPALVLAGLTFVFVGIGFKLAAAPFHMWAPDAYEGAPVPVAAYISVAPKIAAFIVLVRIGLAIAGPAGQAADILLKGMMAISIASMVVGNLAALKQTGFVRMLAYSGIAHAGYMLLALPALKFEGGAALSFYLLVYIFMNLGAFAVAVYLGNPENSTLKIGDLSGLASRRPFPAFALAVFMISLAGIPPTGGFFAKFYLFKSVITAGHLPLAIVAIVMSIVSLFYYLRIVMMMYMESELENPASPKGMPVLSGIILVLVMFVFLAGILPGYGFQIIVGCF